jgi:hypothetical protein
MLFPKGIGHHIGGGIAAVTLATMTLLPAGPAQAQQDKPHSFLHRHATATGVVAGVATHHMLKKSARRARARGQHLSFAQRHPTLTGIAAGVGTHHIVKHHTQ